MSPATVTAALALVRRAHGLEFSDYRPELVAGVLDSECRRAGLGTEAAWVALLEADPASLQALVEALRVAVTSFFRDPEVFEAVQTRVLPRLMHQVSLATTIRAWSIGVGTGEEAWSLAMVIDTVVWPVEWELLGTDIHPDSLRVAAAGRYSVDRLVVPAAHQRYVEDAGAGQVRVVGQLAERVRFVEHAFMGADLAPPESIVPMFHVLSCRNLVLHFDERLRPKAWARLATLLHPAGVLLVGRAEVPDAESGLQPWPGVPRGLGLYRVAR